MVVGSIQFQTNSKRIRILDCYFWGDDSIELEQISVGQIRPWWSHLIRIHQCWSSTLPSVQCILNHFDSPNETKICRQDFFSSVYTSFTSDAWSFKCSHHSVRAHNVDRKKHKTQMSSPFQWHHHPFLFALSLHAHCNWSERRCALVSWTKLCQLGSCWQKCRGHQKQKTQHLRKGQLVKTPQAPDFTSSWGIWCPTMTA